MYVMTEMLSWSTVMSIAVAVIVMLIFLVVGLVVVPIIIIIVLDHVLAAVVVVVLLLGRNYNALQIAGEWCHLCAVRFHLIEAATTVEW